MWWKFTRVKENQTPPSFFCKRDIWLHGQQFTLIKTLCTSITGDNTRRQNINFNVKLWEKIFILKHAHIRCNHSALDFIPFLSFYTHARTNTHTFTQSSLRRPEVEVKSAAKASVCTSKSCVGGWWIPAASCSSHERSISGVKASLKRPLLSDKHLLSSEGCSTTSMEEEEEEEEAGWCRVGWGVQSPHIKSPNVL